MLGGSFLSGWQLPTAWRQPGMLRDERVWWTLIVGVVWVLTTVFYFLIAIGDQGRVYLAKWLEVSFWAVVWPSKWVSFGAQWYEAHTVASSLVTQVYHRPLRDWLCEASLWGLLPVLFVMSLLLIVSWWPATPLWIGWHRVFGARLFPVRRLQRRLRGRSMLGRWKQPRGITLAGVTLPSALEQRHLLVCGAPGGKTTVLRSVLSQIASRGELAIVVDRSRQLLAEFADPARGDVILNPVDARCPLWSPWEEMAGVGEASTVATAWLPDPPPSPSETRSTLHVSAQSLLKTLLQRSQSKEVHKLLQVLAGPHDQLARIVAGTSLASILERNTPEQTHLLAQTVYQTVGGCSWLPVRGDRHWSAKQWAQERTGWVFLTGTEQDWPGIVPVLSLWLDLLLWRLVTSETSQPSSSVWVVIDDLASLHRLPHLETLLLSDATAALNLVIGMQTLAPLQRKYGEDLTSAIMAAPATKLFLQCPDLTTANWCGELLGWQVRYGPTGARGESGTWRAGALVLGSHLHALPDGQGYLQVAGAGIAPVTIGDLPRAVRQPEFLLGEHAKAQWVLPLTIPAKPRQSAGSTGQKKNLSEQPQPVSSALAATSTTPLAAAPSSSAINVKPASSTRADAPAAPERLKPGRKL